jgi:hypothetical protein
MKLTYKYIIDYMVRVGDLLGVRSSGTGDLLGVKIVGGTISQPTKVITVFTEAIQEPIILESTDLLFSEIVVNSINTIDTEYTSRMANRQYADIPTDLNQSLVLHDEVGKQYDMATNTNLRTLLQITLDGLNGSINGYALYTQHLSMAIKNQILEKRIEEILSGKNEKEVMADTCGGFDFTKTFTLAPLFSYYIAAFGMPAFGVGFDKDKLSLIQQILVSAGIDPYSKKST